MSENIIMFCYCADQRDAIDDSTEENRATKMMFDILARAYEREILREGFDEVNRLKKAKGVLYK